MHKNDLETKTITEAAEHSHVTRQAIYVAIKKGKMKANKKGTKWFILTKDLEEYRLNKYSRHNRKVDGELVFDIDKGHYSILQVSKIMSHELRRPYPMQRIYYLVHQGKLRAFKKGCAWVIMQEQVEALLKSELEMTAEWKKFEEA